MSDITLIQEQYIHQQRQWVNGLAGNEFGGQLHKNKSDLLLLKRILDKEIIKQGEKGKFKSMGVALGDIYVHELKLEWKTYEDSLGRSLAVCVPRTDQCLFPVTMLSKRGVLGFIPDVVRIYHRGVEIIEDQLPKVPYTTKLNEKLTAY